jgi:chitinase
MSNPEMGKELFKSTDPRWPGTEGWGKYAQNINGIEVHYQYNPSKGLMDDFKLK